VRTSASTTLLALLVTSATGVLGAMPVVAQEEAPARGGRIELVAGGDLGTLDTNQAVNSIDYDMTAGALYEGLYHFDPDGRLEEGLADGMPEVSDDGLVYTFRLKPGAMFAGPDFEPREVTADDVAYGMTRALDPTPDGAPGPSWGSGYLLPIKGARAVLEGTAESVEGIEVIDPLTLRVTLDAPSVSFLYGLTIATSWPVPPEAVEERGEDFAGRPVGAGPFYVKEWNRGSDITLARNPGYVDPALPYLDEIHVALQVDENTQVLRIESGEADGIFEQFSISPAALRLLEENPAVTVTPSVGTRIFYLALENGGIFGDKDLRLAVAHAMSTDFIAQFGDLARPWNQLVSSTIPQSDPEGTHVYPHDPDRAREYLTSGGYDGTPVKIIYDVADPYQAANSTALKQDLEAVGFSVDLKGLQTGEFFTAVYDPAARDISSTYWSAEYPDAQDFIATNFVCGSFLNISHFCDEAIDAAFYATETMPLGPERDEALREVQQQLIDEVAGVPVMEVTPQVVWGPRVGEIPTLATYAPFDWKRAWLRDGG
jgi:peptide/nickel transport system substrate-binding protein/oligopeptide transport system substrate-binding protein